MTSARRRWSPLQAHEHTLRDQHTRILIVDDEPSIREVLTDFLMLEGHDVQAVQDGHAALAILDQERFDAALIDLKMGQIDGLQVLSHLRAVSPQTIAVMMTGYGTVESAISAMKAGAYDYVLKPFKVQEVIRMVEHAIGQQRLASENMQLRQALSLYEYSERMSASLKLEPIFDLLLEVAATQLEADAASIWTRRAPGQPMSCARLWSRGDLDEERQTLTQQLNLEPLLARHARGEPMTLRGQQAQQVLQQRPLWSADLSVLAQPLTTQADLEGLFIALKLDSPAPFAEGDRKMMAVLCGRAGAALENAALHQDQQRVFKQTIQAFANLLEDKDPYTRGHSERVSRYARHIATGLGLPSEQIEQIADSALLHDIGKLGIRYEDLNKVEPLTESEYEMFKSHTTRGKWMLEPIPFLHPLIPGVYHHHERWDGRGYPLGLAGEEIPLVARILAIADTYDAMTSHRAYRRALPHDVALREIRAFSGAQFDPALVEVFAQEIARDKRGWASKAQRWQALTERPPGGWPRQS